ncbi:class I SAM-dependent methyltransferase [Clostridium sp. BJN0001]|uniref:class I SAM-dependent methyltransferase n=1 Tax=Clostridium sp. BJN0001 TaxID=2930219 RepID=UPI001FD0483F|nr:class I SAM-dependent methyltransferase [Clostridium sp. BJN0001]
MKTNYGNWVPKKLMKYSWILTLLLLIIDIVFTATLKNKVLSVIVSILFLLILSFTIYMQKCRLAFSFDGGNVMGQIHEFVLSKLMWDGKGKLLDIGCGSGALSVRCAKKFKKAQIVGIDYFGSEWDYDKKQCERNAKIEGVSEIIFKNGDAAKLPFKNNYFDAAISNFVFHEVKTQKNKRKVVLEALRVVKKGGAFVFHDMFEQKKLYGDIKEFIDQLRKEGITEIYYEANTENMSFIPNYIKKAPWMFHNMGIIYGIK